MIDIDVLGQLIPNPVTMLVQLCSTLILFLLMKKFLWSSVKNFLDVRSEKMQSDLEEYGCRIDHIYYCPHGWDDGCECRKPKPGLLYDAQHDLSLDLRKCVLFGDDERDVMAGNAAGCDSVMVSEDYPLLQAVREYLK